MAAINPVKIKDWDLKESRKTPNPQVFRHLDLGSANYGPADRGQHSTDLKIYRVLSSNIDRVIAEHPSYKKFTFYLNDLSSEGLNSAAAYLAQHLEQTHQDKGIKIKIVKIASDFFALDPVPSVNSATLLNPEGEQFFGTLVLLSGKELHLSDVYSRFNRLAQDGSEPLWNSSNFLSKAGKMLLLFRRISSASQEGFLVREINMKKSVAQKISTRLSAPEGMTMLGLHFADAEAKTKPILSYISPRGVDFFATDPDRGSISYLVTPASQSLGDSSSDLSGFLSVSVTPEEGDRIVRRLAALRTELEKARQDVANEPPHRLAAFETEFKIAEQECEGYEVEGEWAGVPENPNLVLIRDQSGKAKIVAGQLIETTGQLARDDQGKLIPNRVTILNNEVHPGEVLYSNGRPRLDSQGRLRVRLFDRVLVWGTEQKYTAASNKMMFLMRNAPERQAMKEAVEDAYQNNVAARQRVIELRKELISLRRAEAAREKVVELENQIARLEKLEASIQV